MNELKKIDKLASVLNNDTKIAISSKNNPEFFNLSHVSEFITDSHLSDYTNDLYSNLFDKLISNPMNYINPKHYLLIFERLDSVKELIADYHDCYLSLNGEKRSKHNDTLLHIGDDAGIHINQLKYFLNIYSADTVIENIKARTNEWINYSATYNIDITDHIKNIESNLENLKNIEVITTVLSDAIKLYQSVNFLLNEYSNLININEKIQYYHMSYLDDELMQKKTEYKQIKSQLNIYRNKLHEHINKTDYSLNNEEIKKPIFQVLKDLNIYNSLESINNEINLIHQKIIDSNLSNHLSIGEKFIKNKKKCNIESFLDAKITEDDLLFKIDMGHPSNCVTFFMFKDESLVLKNKNNEYQLMMNNHIASLHIAESFNAYIDNKLNKNPYIAKTFKKLLSKSPENIGDCLMTIDTYLTHENVLKSGGFDILKNINTYLNNEDTHMNIENYCEHLDDEMNKTILDHNIKQYAQSIASKKYLHLYNDESYKIFREIYNLKIEPKLLQDIIGKKMAAFETPEDFNSAVEKLLNMFNNFTLDILSQQAIDNNITIISKEDSQLILKIENFEQSQLLGSSSWCISRNETYFKSYTTNGNSQYFIYNLEKNYKENDSMIGLTLKSDGTFYTAHLKNDNRYDSGDAEAIQAIIIKKDIKSYPNLNSDLKSKLDLSSSVKKEGLTI